MMVVKRIISSLLCLSGTVSVEIKLWCSTSSSLRDANRIALCWLCKQFFSEFFSLKSGGEKRFLGCSECSNKTRNIFWLANYLKWHATSANWTRRFFFHHHGFIFVVPHQIYVGTRALCLYMNIHSGHLSYLSIIKVLFKKWYLQKNLLLGMMAIKADAYCIMK